MQGWSKSGNIVGGLDVKMIIKAAILMALLATLASCIMSRSEVDLAGGSTPLPVTAQGTTLKIVSSLQSLQ
jgi:hypothetical protein